MKIFVVANNFLKGNNAGENALYDQWEPVVFMKADSSLLRAGKPFFVPDFMGRIGFEGHVAVRISRLGKSIGERFAHRYYDAMTLGVDFTALDIYDRARREGLPWDVAKGFDGAAGIGEWMPKEQVADPQAVSFSLAVNGEERQRSSTASLVAGIDRLIAYISQFFTLKTGDLLLTGTPVGGGEVHVGDRLEGWLEGKKVLDIKCK